MNFQCAKCKVIPFAFPYGTKYNKFVVFAVDDYTEIMNHYAGFLKEVIDSSNRTLLCSQEIHTLVKKMFGGKHSLDAYFDHSVCTDGVDMVSLRRGTPAYKLLLRKEMEQAERNSIRQKDRFAKGEGTLPLAAVQELRQRGIKCDDPTKALGILQSNKCAKGEGNLQLAAAKELRQQGIECDDPTKAQSIYESNKCAMGEGNLQLTAEKELCKQGIECDDPMKALSILQSNKCEKGEDNLQLAAAKELCKRGIECDDPTKALSILQSNKFAKGEGGLQLFCGKGSVSVMH